MAHSQKIFCFLSVTVIFLFPVAHMLQNFLHVMFQNHSHFKKHLAMYTLDIFDFSYLHFFKKGLFLLLCHYHIYVLIST